MKRPLPWSKSLPLDQNPLPWAGLVTSLPTEYDYRCEIEGKLPDLHGRHYRLGPGLYERGEGRKRMLLDGDGMMQEFTFEGQSVRYRNRFVQTQKFIEEQKADRFLYPTLSTHSSGPWLENLGINLPHQANITPFATNKRLFAFDESQKPYELDLEDLSTLHETDLDQLHPKLRFWAHFKLDPAARLVHFLAIQQGPTLKATVVSTDADLKLKSRMKFDLPRASYFHDWFVTERYFGFILHPAVVSLKTLARVGLGLDTFSDALKWQPEKGNLIVLIDRQTQQSKVFETEACWMWHSVNAYDQGKSVLVDFIGSEHGGGLGDAESPFYKIMHLKEFQMPKKTTNHLRRYILEPTTSRIQYQTLNQDGNFELPTVSAYKKCRQHEFGHFIHSFPGELFACGLAEWNQQTEQLTSFVSSGKDYFSEPLTFADMKSDSPYLSSLVYSGDRKKSYLAIFKVGSIAEGPIAKIWLKHHTPIGFHSYWLPSS